jgi:hypothetical protein
MVSSQLNDRSKHSSLMPSHGFAEKQLTLALPTVYIRLLASAVNLQSLTGFSGVHQSPSAPTLTVAFTVTCNQAAKHSKLSFAGIPLSMYTFSLHRHNDFVATMRTFLKGTQYIPGPFRGAMVENMSETWAGAAQRRRDLRDNLRPVSTRGLKGKITVCLPWSTRRAGRCGK